MNLINWLDFLLYVCLWLYLTLWSIFIRIVYWTVIKNGSNDRGDVRKTYRAGGDRVKVKVFCGVLFTITVSTKSRWIMMMMIIRLLLNGRTVAVDTQCLLSPHRTALSVTQLVVVSGEPVWWDIIWSYVSNSAIIVDCFIRCAKKEITSHALWDHDSLVHLIQDNHYFVPILILVTTDRDKLMWPHLNINIDVYC